MPVVLICFIIAFQSETYLGKSKVKNEDLWKFPMIFSSTPLEIPLLF